MFEKKGMDDYVYAGFWVRVGATLIDTLIILVIILPIFFAIYGPSYFSPYHQTNTTLDILLNWIFPAVAAILFWIAKSSTPGKMVLGITILDADSGSHMTPVQCVIRYAGYIVSTIPLCLGIFWVGWDKKKQGFHDKIANTVVVRNKTTVEAVSFRG